MKIDNDLMNVTNKLVNAINHNYFDRHVSQKYGDTPYKTTLHCDVTFENDVFTIDCKIPFPLVEVVIRKFTDNDETNLNFLDSDVIIELYRNEQTVAVFNESFMSVAEKSIIEFINMHVDGYKNGDYDNDDNFIVK